MTRFANFCAGPASMPTAVLERAQAEMLDWQGLGTSVMEISHRSTDYIEMAQKPRRIYASSWVSAMSTLCCFCKVVQRYNFQQFR